MKQPLVRTGLATLYLRRLGLTLLYANAWRIPEMLIASKFAGARGIVRCAGRIFFDAAPHLGYDFPVTPSLEGGHCIQILLQLSHPPIGHSRLLIGFE